MELQLAEKRVKVEMDYGFAIFKRKFQGLFSKNKERYLEFRYVQEFLDSLNALRNGLGDQLRQIFLSTVFPVNWEVIRQEILEVGGFIGPILCDNPGAARFMDLLYRYELPQGPLDKLLTECTSGRAVDNRKTSTINHIVPNLLSLSAEKGFKNTNVLNLGSGCGYDVIEMSAGSREIAERVKFINVDIDNEALMRGESLLREERFSYLKGISFLNRNMVKTGIKNAMAAMVIGILCSFSYEVCVRHLRIFKSSISPGGIVYGACVTDKMVSDDLFTSFVLENILNWHLCYRKSQEVEAMFKEAGYIWRPDLTFVEEPTAYYTIGAGEVPRK